jgi:hypothetical protein
LACRAGDLLRLRADTACRLISLPCDIAAHSADVCALGAACQ